MQQISSPSPPTSPTSTYPPRTPHAPHLSFFSGQSRKDVANCHKLPAYFFDRRIVSVDEIAQALHRSLSSVLRANPQARIMLTVSPVRHWRDGPVDNGRSKAHLIAGAHGAIELLRSAGVGEGVGIGGGGHVSYFPSYELVMDDLRLVYAHAHCLYGWRECCSSTLLCLVTRESGC